MMGDPMATKPDANTAPKKPPAKLSKPKPRAVNPSPRQPEFIKRVIVKGATQ